MKNWNKYLPATVCALVFIALIALFILKPQGVNIPVISTKGAPAQAANISPAAGLADIGLGCADCVDVPVYDSVTGNTVIATVSPDQSASWPLVEEYEYEKPGAVISAQASNGRYEIAFQDGKKGWVAPETVKRAHTYPDILDGKLAYLEVASAPLFNAPGAAQPVGTLASPGQQGSELPVQVTDKKLDENANWWVKVEALDRSPCEATQDNPPRTVQSGWVPAFVDGKRTLWFYSRGC